MKRDRPVWALGAMSGTSLDGVDAAMLLTDGEAILEFGPSAYRAYTEQERDVLRAHLGKWESYSDAAAVVENAHAELLSQFDGADVIGFHGQTLAHDPRGRGTLQIGDASLLARVLGVPVVSDFRSADIGMGGEGAPLAPFYHFACARWLELDEPVAFLNLGGVGNLTWIDPTKHRPDEDGALLAFDTGPANAPIDDYVRSRLDLRFDENGELAATGEVNAGALNEYLNNGYFPRVPPKSLDREEFAHVLTLVEDLDPNDAVATLTAMVVGAVVVGSGHFPASASRLFVTGGGRHNATMMRMLQAGLDCPVQSVDAIGLDGDMLEAQAFAYLAVRVMRGLPTSCPSTTGVSAAIGGGVIHKPDAT